jgi:hypothetical protein
MRALSTNKLALLVLLAAMPLLWSINATAQVERPVTRTLKLSEWPGEIAADGDRVAFVRGDTTAVIWTPASRRVARYPFDPGDGCEPGGMALTRDFLAWNCTWESNSGTQVAIYVADRGRRHPTKLIHDWYGPTLQGNLSGNDPYVVFNAGRHVAWQILSRGNVRAKRCPGGRLRCRRVTGGIRIADAAAGRIAGWVPAGRRLVVTDRSGRKRALPVRQGGWADFASVRLDRNAVYVARGNRLAAYALGSLKLLGRWSLAASEYGATLEDVQAGSAIYEVDEQLRAIRLRDGRDVPIGPGGPIGSADAGIDAAFGATGVFYAFTKGDGAQIVFEPRTAFHRRFG